MYFRVQVPENLKMHMDRHTPQDNDFVVTHPTTTWLMTSPKGMGKYEGSTANSATAATAPQDTLHTKASVSASTSLVALGGEGEAEGWAVTGECEGVYAGVSLQ